MSSTSLDALDRAILELLTENARRTITDIAQRVNLSPAPVKRRIQRLEERGIIVGYTLLVDQDKLEGAVEAFSELQFAGTTDIDTIAATVAEIPEVHELFTVAGDPDALARIRARDVQHLKQVINRLRQAEHITGTKTLMALDHWSRSTGVSPSSCTATRAAMRRQGHTF